MKMENKIIAYLKQLEKDKNIQVLLACETGSRAWGFPSTDSDYDVRIIYINDLKWYVGLAEDKDSIELFLENKDIDISGWDIRKTLRLLTKSNPPLLERLQSPIIYTVNDDFLSDMLTLARQFYSRIATIHHYLSMARKTLDSITQHPSYKLKHFFYALRTATACRWILDKEEMPPIVFQQMLDGLDIHSDIHQRIAELTALKATISESYTHHGEEMLFKFIRACIAEAEAGAPSLPSGLGQRKQLDTFLHKLLGLQ
jgi:predicted nucleotidyltransferase